MKKTFLKKALPLGMIFLFFAILIPAIQEESAPETEADDILTDRNIVYDPAGRRDPFRNLLGGSALDEEPVEGVTQMTINDVVLIGILDIEGEITGIVKGPQGFPYYIKKGDKFLDGYVLALDSYQVTFQQTSDRGIPLLKPRKIVKELFQEER